MAKMATINAPDGGTLKVEIRNPREHLQRHWVKGGFYEAGMLEWIRRHHGNDGGTFIDAGACIGNHTLFFAAFCAERVVAVEPVRKSADHLMANLRLNDFDNVGVVNAALGKEPGRCDMVSFAPAGHVNAGMYKVAPGGSVEVATIDQLVQRLGLGDIKLIKVDVEFSELDVLKGAARVLRQQKPALFVEVTDQSEAEVKDFLAGFGYVARSEHNRSKTIEFIIPGHVGTMRVLSLSTYDFAGCAYQLSYAINEMTPHHSRAVRWRKMRLDFPADVTAPGEKELRDLWEWCNVVHIHDTTGGLPSGLPPRPTVITYHGSHYRKAPRQWSARDRARGWVATVATPDLTAWGLPWLPDCRGDLTHLVKPASKFTVAHAPTNKRKGTQLVEDACKRAGIPLVLIEKTPWVDCLAQKARAHVFVDQFRIAYGCNAIEAWAMGLPVIAGAEDQGVIHVVDKLVGFRPFYNCVPSVDAIATALVNLRDDSEMRKDVARAGQRAFEKLHTYEAAAARAVEFYRQAIKGGAVRQVAPSTDKKRPPRQRPPRGQPVLDHELVLVHYLGGSDGNMPWHAPPTGTCYNFSRGQPRRWVYGPDVEWFLDQKNKRDKPIFRLD